MAPQKQFSSMLLLHDHYLFPECSILGYCLLAESVSSAAARQLSCDVSAQLSSAQLSCYPKAQLQLVNSAVRSAATCQLSCTLLAEVKLVISAATCWLSGSLSAHRTLSTRLQSVSSTVIFSSAAIYQLTATHPVAVSSIQLVRVNLLGSMHSAFNIAHTPPSAQDKSCCHYCLLNVTLVIHHQLLMKHTVHWIHSICAHSQCSIQKRISAFTETSRIANKVSDRRQAVPPLGEGRFFALF